MLLRQRGQQTVLRVDQMVAMVSTIECVHCHHTLSSAEPAAC